MKFNSKSYFKSFLKENLIPENAYEIYEIFEVLGIGEEPLFKNCCKFLGITRDKFLDGFNCFAELSRIDEDYGLTELAMAEKFGKLIYYEGEDEAEDKGDGDGEDFDESEKSGYEMVESTEIDKTNPEYIEFCRQLYHATVHDLVARYKEKDFDDATLVSIVEKIGAFHERSKNMCRRTDGSLTTNKEDETVIEREAIYNELSSVLTDYEEGNTTADDLYSMLIKIQNSWEYPITAQ